MPSTVHVLYSSALSISSSPVSSACSAKITISRMLALPVSRSSPIFRSSLTAMGEREIAFWVLSWPRSILFAIATSPSRVSKGTTPISRRYKRTGSLVFSSAPAERSSSTSSSVASSSSIATAAACSSRRSSESATGIFDPSSFCSTSSMSSGEMTLSGSSRFRSSNVRYFLSPPNSRRRSITSSRSLSSILKSICSNKLWFQMRVVRTANFSTASLTRPPRGQSNRGWLSVGTKR